MIKVLRGNNPPFLKLSFLPRLSLLAQQMDLMEDAFSTSNENLLSAAPSSPAEG